MICVGALRHVVFKASRVGAWTVVIAFSFAHTYWRYITVIILYYGHNAIVGCEHAADDGSRTGRERSLMRYTKDHKQATRQRILEAAGRRFKQHGIDGAGVAAVMSDPA